MSTAAELDGIAIIGMACRFPGADTPTVFWHNLCHGVESITFFADAELLAAGVDPALLQDPNYVKASPILHDVDKFDAAFFEYSPKEATLMDPQHRLFLEVAWETFEDAGYAPEAYGGTVGVFAGAGGIVTSYLLAHHGHPALPGATASVPHLGNDKDFISTRVSYKLNLTGPSLTVQTACSTSLVAVHLACQSLLSGECDMALAGAATIRIPHISGYVAEKGNVHSLDGHCRAFDAAGQGTIFGSGVGTVLLKKVQDAVTDGDHIYAVLKSTAVNNDGAMKVSYTAPSVIGQARAMVEAFTLADVPPETISYVECHATGTTVGDPLEIQALTRAFRTQTARLRFCAIGSVKTNIGHPEQAAGLAALIKTALSLQHQRLPPSLHFVTPNPNIDFDTSPFYVNTTLRDWPADRTPRRAAVNSLGIGGTNAFAVLEEAPAVQPAPQSWERPLHLFSLSAKDAAGLVAYAEKFQRFLDTNSALNLADLCYTTNVSRSHFAHRFAVTTASLAELREKLAAFVTGAVGASVASSRAKPPPIVFLCTGQGAQYPGMAADLYQTQPTFRAALEECDAYLRPHLDRALLEVLFAQGEDALLVHETAYTQPALFAVEYALAQLWQAWGVVPEAVMGHSVGELVAACLAGALDLKDALHLVAVRGQLMQSLPKHGTMAVVFAAEAVVQDALTPYCNCTAIAAVNGPHNTVISGERQAVAQLLETLQGQGIASQALTVSHAFHSPLMDPMLEAFAEAASPLAYRAPRLTLISNVTGQAMDQPPSPQYWREHVRHPVRFADGMQTLQALGYECFLEIGPGSALLSMGQRCLPTVKATWLPSLNRQQNAWQVLLESLRQLYLAGFLINWQQVDQGYTRRRLSLPTYPFQRKRYWLEAPARDLSSSRHAQTGAHPLLGTRLRSALQECQFEAVYSLDHLPYLEDHRIYGMLVLPTTAGIEAALMAGQACFHGSAVRLESLTYHEALVLAADETRLVQVILPHPGADTTTFQLLSTRTDGQDNWRLHMSGVLRKAPASDAGQAPPACSVAELQARCPGVIPAARYYAAVRAMGLDYGPTFQGIQQLWQGDGEALSYVCLPPQVTPGPYRLHPAFLDACLHLYPALVKAYGDFTRPPEQDAPMYLPIGIERFQVFTEHLTEACVHAVLRHNAGDHDTLVLDLRLYDQAAHLVAAFDGLSVRCLPPDALRPPEDAVVTDWLYHMRWDEQALPIPAQPAAARAGGSWLIFADRQGVGEALAALLQQHGDQCHLVFPDTACTHLEHRSSIAPSPSPALVTSPQGGKERRGEGQGQEGTGGSAQPRCAPHPTSPRWGEGLETVSRDDVTGVLGPRRWTVNPTQRQDFHQIIQEVCTAASPPCQGVVYLWGVDVPVMADMTCERLESAEALGAGGALWLFQALAAARAMGAGAPPLWLITRNAQQPDTALSPLDAPQALLWGLGRTIFLESPHLWGGLVDLAPAPSTTVRQDAAALLAELLRVEREDQVALRAGRRFVARLARLPQARAVQDAMRFHADATYLITGGLGMLGLKMAQWLVQQQGVRHLVLTGRRGAQGAAQEAIQALEALGAQVQVIQADVSVEADVQRLVDTIQQHLPPLKGVFHGAGLLEDGILSQLDWSQFTRVTAPKVKGSWLLHHYTQHLPLDLFVLQSSVLSLIGSAGQANYTAANAFLDALVDYRRALGLPAMAINWGPWDEAGMATVSGTRGEAIWKARGMRYIPPEAGLRVFDYLIHHPVAHATVTITDWSVYLEQLPEPLPVYAELTRQAQPRRDTPQASGMRDVRTRLQQAPQQEHRAILVDFVLEQVMRELGFDEAIDTRQPLNGVGLDSLMSVNVANRLENALQVVVPVVTLIQGPSIEQLVEALFPDLGSLSATAVPPETADAPAPTTTAPTTAAIPTLPPRVETAARVPLQTPARTSVTAGNGWLVFPKPNPTAQVRLFCFPFAGAGAATFRSWGDMLAPSIEIVAIEPPGRASRIHEPPLSTFDRFLELLVPTMLPYLDKPCALFGHCLGALTLFETARTLLHPHQAHLQHLFVSGARPPHLVQQEGAFEEHLLYTLLQHNKFDPFLPTYQQPDEVFAEVIRHFNIGASEEFLDNPELRRLLLPTIRAEFAMTFHYRYTPEPPWEVPITCFLGLGDPYVTRDDVLAWGQYTKIAFQFYMREGTHFTIVDDKDFLVQTINRELAV